MSDVIFTLAALGPGWLANVLLPLFILICVIMVLVVLIQKPQGGGLAGAFGGSSAGSGQTAFGTKTGDALTVFTVGVFVLFVLVAILLNLAMKAPKISPEAVAQPASSTAPAETTPAPGGTDNTVGGSLPTSLPTGLPSGPAPVSPGAELPANVTTPAAPAPTPAPATEPAPGTSPAPAPAQPDAPKPDGGF